MAVAFDSAAVAAEDRFEAWRQALTQAFIPLEASPAAALPFDARLGVLGSGPVKTVSITAQAHRSRRTARQIRLGGDAYFKVGYLLEGRCRLQQDGRSLQLNRGQVAMTDTSREYELSFDGPYKLLTFMLPVGSLGVPDRWRRDITARNLVDPASPTLLTTLLDHYVGCLEGNREMGLWQAVVLDALGAVVQDGMAGSGARRRSGTDRDLLVGRIKADIDERLSDPELSAAHIARTHHVSERYLHRLFEDSGESVGERIRRLRLAAVGRDLGNPLLRGVSIAALGARWGMHDPSHFSRSFKARFGVGPAAWRAQQLDPDRVN